MAAVVQQRLGELAEAINQQHTLFEEAAGSAVEHACRAGQLLCEAKAQIEHGGWLPWIEANCSFGTRAAQGYMRVSRRIAELPESNAQHVALLPLRGLLAAFTEPKKTDPLDHRFFGALAEDCGSEEFYTHLDRMNQYGDALDAKRAAVRNEFARDDLTTVEQVQHIKEVLGGEVVACTALMEGERWRISGIVQRHLEILVDAIDQHAEAVV